MAVMAASANISGAEIISFFCLFLRTKAVVDEEQGSLHCETTGDHQENR